MFTKAATGQARRSQDDFAIIIHMRITPVKFQFAIFQMGVGRAKWQKKI